ncbi:MAG: hypothetical protein CSB33_01490 [Desulfobacterales bacterium]|nr:MAG: hypothetical protein CSB33_01490 [Desulfobacterales bacterium]
MEIGLWGDIGPLMFLILVLIGVMLYLRWREMEEMGQRPETEDLERLFSHHADQFTGEVGSMREGLRSDIGGLGRRVDDLQGFVQTDIRKLAEDVRYLKKEVRTLKYQVGIPEAVPSRAANNSGPVKQKKEAAAGGNPVGNPPEIYGTDIHNEPVPLLERVSGDSHYEAGGGDGGIAVAAAAAGAAAGAVEAHDDGGYDTDADYGTDPDAGDAAEAHDGGGYGADADYGADPDTGNAAEAHDGGGYDTDADYGADPDAGDAAEAHDGGGYDGDYGGGDMDTG